METKSKAKKLIAALLPQIYIVITFFCFTLPFLTQAAALKDEDPSNIASKASSPIAGAGVSTRRVSVLSDHPSDDEELRDLIKEAKDLGFSEDEHVKRTLRGMRYQKKLEAESSNEARRAAFLAKIGKTSELKAPSTAAGGGAGASASALITTSEAGTGDVSPHPIASPAAPGVVSPPVLTKSLMGLPEPLHMDDSELHRLMPARFDHLGRHCEIKYPTLSQIRAFFKPGILINKDTVEQIIHILTNIKPEERDNIIELSLMFLRPGMNVKNITMLISALSNIRPVASRAAVVEIVQKRLCFPDIEMEELEKALITLGQIKPENRVAIADMFISLRDAGIPSDKLSKIFRIMTTLEKVDPWVRETFMKEVRRFITPDTDSEEIAAILTSCVAHLFMYGGLKEEERISFLKFLRDKMWQPWMNSNTLQQLFTIFVHIPLAQRESIVSLSFPIVTWHTYPVLLAPLINQCDYKNLSTFASAITLFTKLATLGIEEKDIVYIVQRVMGFVTIGATAASGSKLHYFVPLLEELIWSIPPVVTNPKDRKDFMNFILEAKAKYKGRPDLYESERIRFTADFIKKRYPGKT